MQVTYDHASGRITTKGQSNRGQPRRWHVTIRVKTSLGNTTTSFKPTNKCNLPDLLPAVHEQIRKEYEVDPTIELLGFTATAR